MALPYRRQSVWKSWVRTSSQLLTRCGYSPARVAMKPSIAWNKHIETTARQALWCRLIQVYVRQSQRQVVKTNSRAFKTQHKSILIVPVTTWGYHHDVYFYLITLIKCTRTRTCTYSMMSGAWYIFTFATWLITTSPPIKQCTGSSCMSPHVFFPPGNKSKTSNGLVTQRNFMSWRLCIAACYMR